MRFPTALTGEATQLVDRSGDVDLLVGVPSYENAKSIGHVARTCARALATRFAGDRVLLVNSDGNSADGTREAFVSAGREELGASRVLSFKYQGVPGKGTAVRGILETAVLTRATAVVLVDADLRSITADWIQRLARPVLSGEYDFVAPYYVRDKNDATITNHICYPVMRALYGVAVRQPIGGDFGVSGDLTKALVTSDVWDSDVARFGIDIWMTTTAVATGHRIAQAWLGTKVHDAKDPVSDLAPMFREVVGTVFRLMGQYHEIWVNDKEKCQTAPVLYRNRQRPTPEPVRVSPESLRTGFVEGWRAHRNALHGVLPSGDWDALEATALRCHHACHSSDSEGIRDRCIPARIWARSLYAVAAEYNRLPASAEGTRRSLLEALIPLYLGRVLTFTAETRDPVIDPERVIEDQAQVFWELKPFLESRWPK